MQTAAAAAHDFVVSTQVYEDCKPYVASLWETTKKILSDAVSELVWPCMIIWTQNSAY